MIGVFQSHHTPDRFFLPRAFHVGHEAAHFHDPNPAGRIELHRDRRLHERIGGHNFDAEAGGQLEGLEFVPRRKGRRGRDFFPRNTQRLIGDAVIGRFGRTEERPGEMRGTEFFYHFVYENTLGSSLNMNSMMSFPLPGLPCVNDLFLTKRRREIFSPAFAKARENTAALQALPSVTFLFHQETGPLSSNGSQPFPSQCGGVLRTFNRES